MHKALLVIPPVSSVMKEDYLSLSVALKQANVKVVAVGFHDLDNYIDELEVEEFDFIAMTPVADSSYVVSEKSLDTVQKLFNRSAAGTIHFLMCDLNFGLDPLLWNSHDPESKLPVYSSKPVRVLAALDYRACFDKNTMKAVQDLWMDSLHPDSDLIFFDWLYCHLGTMEHEFNNKTSWMRQNSRNALDHFYYGINKPDLIKSLTSLGLGSNPSRDGVFGSIGKSFPTIKNYRRESISEFDWIEYALNSEKLLLPYEPIKSDYQLTKRILEYALVHERSNNVVHDNRVSDRLLKFLDKSLWNAEYDRFVKNLSDF